MIKEVLKESKACLQGKTFKAICFVALYISLVIMFTSQELIVTLLMLPLEFGVYKYFLNFRKGEEKIEDIITYYVDFKKGLKLALALFWYIIIVIFGLLLFVVPGIIFSYRYILSMYLLIENDDMTIEEAFNKSKMMMKGYKFKFFLLPMIITILPLIMYLVGLGMITSGVTNMSAIAMDEIGQEVIEELDSEFVSEIDMTYDEDTMTIEVEDLDEISDETIDAEGIVESENFEFDVYEDTEGLKNVGIVIAGIIIFIVGIIWLVIVTPRAILAEVIMYEKIKANNADAE